MYCLTRHCCCVSIMKSRAVSPGLLQCNSAIHSNLTPVTCSLNSIQDELYLASSYRGAQCPLTARRTSDHVPVEVEQMIMCLSKWKCSQRHPQLPTAPIAANSNHSKRNDVTRSGHAQSNTPAPVPVPAAHQSLPVSCFLKLLTCAMHDASLPKRLSSSMQACLFYSRTCPCMVASPRKAPLLRTCKGRPAPHNAPQCEPGS